VRAHTPSDDATAASDQTPVVVRPSHNSVCVVIGDSFFFTLSFLAATAAAAADAVVSRKTVSTVG
jgi:hypothetical protein